MFKVISPFDYGTIASSACKTEKIYLHFHKTYNH